MPLDLNQRIESRMTEPDGRVEQRAVGGVFTTLGLILLTFMVFLMSLTEPDRERRTNVYTSLAKAFLFAEQPEPEPVPEHSPQLLSAPRMALRDLAAYLDRSGAAEAMVWERANLVVNLPEGEGHTVPRALLTYLARLGAAMGVAVNVEAYAAPEDAARVNLHRPLSQAVIVAEGLTGQETGLNPAQVQAGGFLSPFRMRDGLDAETMRMRVVFVNAGATL